MARYLLPTTPIYGHVMPMLAVGQGLQDRGNSVTVLTGRKYRSAVESRGMAFRALPAEVDFDDADLGAWLPDREKHRGVAAGRHDIIGMFVRTLPAQYRAVATALASERHDGVLAEAAFLGVLPLLLTPADRRVPVAGVSVTPLSLTSVDCAPFGSGLEPGSSAHTRWRNRSLNAVLRTGPLKPVESALEAALASVGAPKAGGSYFDLVARFDVTFQLAVAGIEYPRRELPASVRFVGPLPPPVADDGRVPGWAGDLDGRRPVVHVTQGTMANGDLGRLLVPALRGLADEDVLVVASTGRRPVSDLVEQLGGRLPGNARVAEFLPYGWLLPRTDVVVSNGGFGGVQQALAHGLPLVVAGVTEDKPEVAARVAWSGAGLNLRTGAPSPARLRRAVRTVLREPRYREAARRLQDEIARQPDPVAVIADTVTGLTAARSGPLSTPEPRLSLTALRGAAAPAPTGASPRR